MIYGTRAFWFGTIERSVKTFAQSLLSLWTVGNGFNILQVDWQSALGVSGGALVFSVLTSLATPNTVAGSTKEVTQNGRSDV